MTRSRLLIENWLIIISMLLLTLFGILCMWSLMPTPFGLSESQPLGSSATLTKILTFQPAKQIIFGLFSLFIFILILRINYYKLKDYSWAIYLLLLFFLVVLLIMGVFTKGARRWFSFGPIAFQPSEFMKIAMVLMTARILMYKQNLSRLSGLIIPFILTVIPMGLIILQPDLGTALVFLPSLFIMLYVAGARVKYLVIAILLILLTLPVGYFMLKDYQRSRLKVFIDPSKSPSADAFQLISSRIAIGSGGIIGQGWGDEENTPSVFVPERHNDFVFTIIGEEWGFAGTAFVVFLYFVIIISSLLIATTTREPFGRLIIVGLVTLMTVQVFINIGMTIGLAPVTGLTLPLISYGGSSLLSTFIILGLINNIRIQQIPSFAHRDFV